jgi:dihydrofolate reductase
MGTLVYTVIASADGFTADAAGGFDWAMPDEELHAFMNDLERRTTASLYGRRMYETMRVWETIGDDPGTSAVERDYAAVWRGLDKVVYSRSLEAVSTTRTRLEREFDPAEVRRFVAAADGAVSVSGPTLAAHAIRAGIVDEYQVVSVPELVGGGTPVFPSGVRVSLELVEQRRFAAGAVFHRYRRR